MKRKNRFVVTPIALLSFKEASSYYKNKGGDRLSQVFKRGYKNTIDQIDRFPESYAIKLSELREAPIINFPCLIIYTVEKDQIIILDIFNTHQDPERKPSI